MFKKFSRVTVIILISGFTVFFFCPLAHSADFPKGPVKIVITTDVGGGEDSDARAMAPYLRKHLGVPVVVENQTGAGGKIAFERFQKTKPDGHTIVLYNFPKSIVIEYMDIGKVNFRTMDYAPIYAWNRSDQLLIVHADTWNNFNDFLKAAKAKTLSGGIMGRGSNTHLGGLIAMEELGVKVNWVPYEGNAQALAALAGKHLDFVICLSASATSLIDAGKLRPLLLLGDMRDPYLPDTPIPKDLGYNITGLFPAIRCAFAPPRTPAPVVKILEDAFIESVKEPGYVDWAKKRRIVLHTLSSREFGNVVSQAYSSIEKFQYIFKQE